MNHCDATREQDTRREPISCINLWHELRLSFNLGRPSIVLFRVRVGVVRECVLRSLHPRLIPVCGVFGRDCRQSSCTLGLALSQRLEKCSELILLYLVWIGSSIPIGILDPKYPDFNLSGRAPDYTCSTRKGKACPHPKGKLSLWSSVQCARSIKIENASSRTTYGSPSLIFEA